MRASAPPWPSRVPDRALVLLAAASGLLFLILAAGNPIQPVHLLRLQFAFTPERWNAVVADGATVEAIRSHLVRDVAGMMPAYTVFLTALFTLRWRRASRGGSRASGASLLRSAWLPPAVFAFDLVENALMWAAAVDAGPGAGLMLALSTAAAAKWLALLVILLGPLASAMSGRGAQGVAV